MEKKFLKYTVILVIFFFGLSMGVSYKETSRSDKLQQELKDFEDDITQPNNDFTPTNPNGDIDPINLDNDDKIEGNLFTAIGKDGEYLIKRGISLVLNKSDDFFRMIFS